MSNEAKSSSLADAIAALRKELSVVARVAEKGTPEYEEGRKPGWNKSVEAQPSLIIRCTDTRDVSLAVKFCRSQKLPFTVAGGRHSSFWLKNDHVLIDLGGMRGVIVDAASKIAHVQGGARNEDVDHATAAYGLYTPMGHHGDTGVGGLVSAGGVGHLSRKYGLAIDNLVSAELVDYQGQVLQASETQNPDLFWAVRGAAHNFGVVTRFSFRLHAIGHVPKPNDDIPAGSVLGGLVLHPIEEAVEAFKRFEEWNTTKLDNGTSGMVVMATIPTGEFKVVVNPVYIGDDIRKGIADTEPLVNWGTVQLNVVRPQSYFELQHQADGSFGEGKWYERAALVSKLTDDMIAGLVKLYTELPRGKEHRVVACQNLGGKIAELPDESSAFGHRTFSRFWVIIATRYEDEDKATAINFVEKIRDFFRGFDCGSFSNSMNGVDQETAQAAFGRSADRLRELKAKYDPENVFNTNVRLLASRK